MRTPSTFKTSPRFYKRYFKHFLNLFLLLIFIPTPTIHSRGCEIPLVVGGAGMGATIGCGGGAAVGSSFGPVGIICGLAVGGLIGFLVKKCARKVETKYDGLWFNHSTEQTNKIPTKTIEDIIGECEPFGHKRSLKQYIKEGGYEEALKDFESLELNGIQDIKKGNVGKWGTLPDGRRVNVRMDSEAGVPTLEIYNPVDKTQIKIRYV